MTLDSLTLTNFKNIAEAHLELSPGLNCFVGGNGMGKSNLLDAIHFLSFTRSFSGVPDQMLISRGEEFAIVRGLYTRRDTPEELNAAIRAGRRKSLRRAGKEYKRLSEHIGAFPAVLVSPADMALVSGSGEERRRFADMVVSMGDPVYLDALIRYNTALEQRNRMLRDGLTDAALYEAVELPMAMAADLITARRAAWVEALRPMFERFYTAIAGDDEEVGIVYQPSIHEGLDAAANLERTRARDMAAGHTTSGPHRDDIEMTLCGMPLRRTGSQGQTKTFTIAMRLAQHEFTRRATGLRPLLLLDDIFDKLDAVRVERIMELVTSGGFGQIFVTDTNRKHLDEIISRSVARHRLWHVDHGHFTPA